MKFLESVRSMLSRIWLDPWYSLKSDSSVPADNAVDVSDEIGIVQQHLDILVLLQHIEDAMIPKPEIGISTG
jgi:hypothetical protein